MQPTQLNSTLSGLLSQRHNASSCVVGVFTIVFVLALLFGSECVHAQQLITGVIATPEANGSTRYSVPIQTLLFFSFLSFLPALLLMMTGFTRIVIVLSLLRMAMGTQNSPPNQVIIGLSLFLTLFIMTPVFDKMYQDAYQPFANQEIQLITS